MPSPSARAAVIQGEGAGGCNQAIINVILYPLRPVEQPQGQKADSGPHEYKYIKCFHQNKRIKTVQNRFQERGIKTMHLRMRTRPLSVPHLIRLRWYTQMAGGEGEIRLRDDRMKGDELAAVQPRMRLDLPPGGFLRPAGRPAAESSAGGASSGCPGTLSGSTLFSEDIRRHTRELTPNFQEHLDI